MNCDLTKDKVKGKIIDDLHEWRNSLSLYPLPKPFIDINASESVDDKK
jgi:hypothetical protein